VDRAASSGYPEQLRIAGGWISLGERDLPAVRGNVASSTLAIGAT
jgi:hypothetical protein